VPRGRALSLSCLQTGNKEKRPPRPSDPADGSSDRRDPELDTIDPRTTPKAVRHDDVIRVVDDASSSSVHERWATNIVTGLARLGGHAVGCRRHPDQLARRALLDIDESTKAAASCARATRSTSPS